MTCRSSAHGTQRSPVHSIRRSEDIRVLPRSAGRPVQATDRVAVTVHAMSVTDRRHIDVDRAPRQHPERRPCRGGRRFTALLCAGMFFLGPTMALSLGAQAARFENRPLAAFGDPRDGWPWLAGLPAWAADNLPLRDRAVAATGAVSRGVFGEPAPLAGPLAGSSPVGPAVAAGPQPGIDPFPSGVGGGGGGVYLRA